MGDLEKRFEVNNLKDFLQGMWSLERRVSDRRSGHEGRLSGEAAFTADGEGLLYREEGRLSIGDRANPVYEGPALQAYRYAFAGAARAAVAFSDGRPFHDLDLRTGRWRCCHLCAPDRYDGDFTALDANAWRVVWTVTGPRKDLVLDSTYRRRL